MLSQVVVSAVLSDKFYRYVQCHWDKKILKTGDHATMDEYGDIYCNQNCFNEEVDEEMRFHEKTQRVESLESVRIINYA